MTLTLVRLAFAGIRSRRLASALTILLSAAAAATIVLALEVGGTARDPWERTFEAAHGAHVLANASSEADARSVARRPGVVERAAPMPIARVAVAGGEGCCISPHPVAPPPSTRRCGRRARPRDGAVVLERASPTRSACAWGPAPARGGRVAIVGIAISPSQPRYPRRNPGLAWVTRATLEQVVPDRRTWRWVQAVRLRDPAAAPAFAAQLVGVETWQDQRAMALAEAQPITLILTTYTIVLLLVVFAVVAILVGARVSEQHREIGLLKAVGLTPRQVGAVFVIESAALGLIAVVIGFSIGVLGAPRLAAASAETMLGSPTTAANPWHLVFAAVPVLLVLVASARSATRRSTRFSVLHAIQSGTATPASPSRLTRALARVSLPVPLALGLTDLLARRHRAIRLAAAIAVTGAAVVFALSMEASLDAQAAGKVSDVPDELPVLVYTLDALLLVITLTALAAVALLSVRERIRDYGVLKTIGMTPRQIASSLVSAHTAVALVAAVLAIPLGLALYVAVYEIAGGSSEDRVLAPWWWLALVPVGTVLLVVLATSLPARLATRIRTADALRYE